MKRKTNKPVIASAATASAITVLGLALVSAPGAMKSITSAIMPPRVACHLALDCKPVYGIDSGSTRQADGNPVSGHVSGVTVSPVSGVTIQPRVLQLAAFTKPADKKHSVQGPVPVVLADHTASVTETSVMTNSGPVIVSRTGTAVTASTSPVSAPSAVPAASETVSSPNATPSPTRWHRAHDSDGSGVSVSPQPVSSPSSSASSEPTTEPTGTDSSTPVSTTPAPSPSPSEPPVTTPTPSPTPTPVAPSPTDSTPVSVTPSPTVSASDSPGHSGDSHCKSGRHAHAKPSPVVPSPSASVTPSTTASATPSQLSGQ